MEDCVCDRAGVVFPEVPNANGIPLEASWVSIKKSFLSRAVFCPLRLFSPFLFPLLLSHSFCLLPLQNGCLYVQRLWAGVTQRPDRCGTAAAVSGLLRPDESEQKMSWLNQDQPLCEAGSDGAGQWRWSGRSSHVKSAFGVGPKAQLQLFL